MYRYVQVIPVNQNLRLQTAPRAQFPTIDFLLLALNTVKKKSWIWSSQADALTVKKQSHTHAVENFQ